MGPLQGLRVIELEGLGPAPFCGMLLADMGAEVISIARASSNKARPEAISERGKKSIALNLKTAGGIEAVLKLCETADILIEGFRPGVTERLGIGPEQTMVRNPRLVYGRMTGWGQEGPLANVAGHDINYISLTGALHAIGRNGANPIPPLNLVGDFGGGSMFLAFGVACAVIEAKHSGKGQVVDAAMVDGAANLMHMMYGFMAAGQWRDQRESNFLDGAAHFYSTYETADGKYVSIGSIEPQFHALLLEKTGLDPKVFKDQMNQEKWLEMKHILADVMMTKTRDEWCDIMEGTDICFSPVLSMREAPHHLHNRARNTFLNIDGVDQAAPAPRFSRTSPAQPKAPNIQGSDTLSVLMELGYSHDDIAAMKDEGVLP